MIISTTQDFAKHKADTDVGYSGAPVVNVRGEVLGFHSRSCEADKTTMFVPFSKKLVEVVTNSKQVFLEAPSQQ